jgi:L-fuculose-phosphate aldolase
MREEMRLRADLIRICRKLEEKGLVAATDGNVSCLAGEGRMLITPSGKPKGEIEPIDLLMVNMQAEVLSGSGRPSSEIRMHLLVYRKRPDIKAIVHAHPPMLTALSVAGIPFMAEVLPEVWLTFGRVPTTPYATPTTEEVPESLDPFVGQHDAILMERHGSLTLGRDLMEAYLRLDKLEHAAHTLFYATLLKGTAIQPLSDTDLKKLEGVKAK